MAYRRRLERDLDRWIAAGHVSPDRRAAMLAMVEPGPRLDAATALAWIGAVLLGLAVIALVAANWDGLPRMVRFTLVLALFALMIGGAAWAASRNRPALSNGLATLAALVFAAAVGLVGQIFDIAGKPEQALIGSGIAAAAIALAGRSTGAGVVALALVGIGDGMSLGDNLWWLTAAAVPAALAAWSWRSAALAHAASLALLVAIGWLCGRADHSNGWFLLASVGAAGIAALARSAARRTDDGVFPTFYGWAVWSALLLLVAAGVAGADGATAIPHRLAWLAAAAGAIALGRHDRHALITTGGVLFLVGAAMAILVDLGVNLVTAAALFFFCALAAIGGGLALRYLGKARGT